MPCPAEELRRYGHWDLDLSPAEFITERMSQVFCEISKSTFLRSFNFQLLLLGTYRLITLEHWVHVLPLYCDSIGALNITSRHDDFRRVSEVPVLNF